MSLQATSIDRPPLQTPSTVLSPQNPTNGLHKEAIGANKHMNHPIMDPLEEDTPEYVPTAFTTRYPLSTASSLSSSHSDYDSDDTGSSLGTSISSRSGGRRRNRGKGITFEDRDYTIRSSTPVFEWSHVPGYGGDYDELSQLGGAFFDHEHTALGEPPYLTLDTDDINHDLDILRAGGKGSGDWPPMNDTLLGRGHRGRGEKRHDHYTQHRKGKKYGKYHDRDGGVVIEIAGRPVRARSRYRSHSRHRA